MISKDRKPSAKESNMLKQHQKCQTKTYTVTGHSKNASGNRMQINDLESENLSGHISQRSGFSRTSTYTLNLKLARFFGKTSNQWLIYYVALDFFIK